jgi:pyruvate formate lyase activating enzyme
MAASKAREAQSASLNQEFSLTPAEILAEKKLALSYSGPLKEALLWQKADSAKKGAVRCKLCAHYCIIGENDVGLCLVRKNIGGKLYSLSWGQADGLAMDPIEKKPFFHFKPGSWLLSFGTPGCNFRCLNCQNWQLSQGMRNFGAAALSSNQLSPKQIAQAAIYNKADGIAYTYSEPTIFFEYARDTIIECRKLQDAKKLQPGFFHVFVSNGYFTKEMLELVVKEKLLSAIRIDLKFMDDSHYWKVCGGRLKPVLDSIRRVAELQKSKEWPIHLEVINLVIPGQNDSDDDFREVASFIYSLSPDIPLHFSRFFPYYKMGHLPPTSVERLQKAKKISEDIGLKYVYIGNVSVPGGEDTLCPKCKKLLISRNHFGIIKNVFSSKEFYGIRNPSCPYCGEKISLVL